MSDLARKLFGDDLPAKPLALIVDLDDTLCTGFDLPILVGIEVLRRVDRQKVAVHYVTARTEASRKATERFLEDNRLPGWRNLHLCPSYLGSPRHKADKHRLIAKEYRVIASIGDYDPDEGEASRQAGVPFVLVDPEEPSLAWAAAAELICEAGGFAV